jgi:hypothetical protein
VATLLMSKRDAGTYGTWGTACGELVRFIGFGD